MKILACMFLLVSNALFPFSLNETRVLNVPQAVPQPPPAQNNPDFKYATDELWQYLSDGLNYLESPKPLAPPQEVPPSYVHPDKRGFGAYGFSPEAYADVRRLYPYFRDIGWEQIMGSQKLYALANRAFCDWLLSHLQEYLSPSPTRAEIFGVVQQAWNLGLGGFRNGRKVVASRCRRSREFLLRLE